MAEFLFLGAAMAIKVLRKTAEQVLGKSSNFLNFELVDTLTGRMIHYKQGKNFYFVQKSSLLQSLFLS